jgi:hypothetical protein
MAIKQSGSQVRSEAVRGVVQVTRYLRIDLVGPLLQ